MIIRPERPTDHDAVHEVVAAAFGRDAEADLVDALRREADDLISLVAEEEGEIVGQILFSPMRMERSPDGERTPRLSGLGPMAVRPDHQRRGIGSALIREGIDRCREAGCDAIFVLGHPGYYPRFGFVPASARGFTCIYPVPDEVFMIHPLRVEMLHGARGRVLYHEAFDRMEG